MLTSSLYITNYANKLHSKIMRLKMNLLKSHFIRVQAMEVSKKRKKMDDSHPLNYFKFQCCFLVNLTGHFQSLGFLELLDGPDSAVMVDSVNH